MTVYSESQSSSALASTVFSSGGKASSSPSPSVVLVVDVGDFVIVNEGAGTGDSAILTLVPGVGAAVMGAGAKLNPEDSPDAGTPPVALLPVVLKENVGVLAAGVLVEFCSVEPNENATGAGAGAKSDLVVSVLLGAALVDTAPVFTVTFVADSPLLDRRLFMVVRYLIAGNS